MSTISTISPRNMIYLAGKRAFSNAELLHCMRPDTPWRRENFKNVFRGFAQIVLRRSFKRERHIGQLWARFGEEDLGLISLQIVTNAGAEFIANAHANIAILTQIRYHAWGKGNSPEDVSNVELDDELTTEINPVNLRAIGTLSKESARIFKSVGITSIVEGANLREFGMWTAQPVGTGMLADRAMIGNKAVSANISAISNYFLEYMPDTAD